MAARFWRPFFLSGGACGHQPCARMNRIAVPSLTILSQTARFSSSLKNTQFDTSTAVRPHPLQTSSNSVEQTPMQGLSGRSCRVDMRRFVKRSGRNPASPHYTKRRDRAGEYERRSRRTAFLRFPTRASCLLPPASRLPTPDSRLPTPDSRLPTPDSQLPTPNSQLPTPNSQLPTPNSGLRTQRSRSLTAKCCTRYAPRFHAGYSRSRSRHSR